MQIVGGSALVMQHRYGIRVSGQCSSYRERRYTLVYYGNIHRKRKYKHLFYTGPQNKDPDHSFCLHTCACTTSQKSQAAGMSSGYAAWDASAVPPLFSAIPFYMSLKLYLDHCSQENVKQSVHLYLLAISCWFNDSWIALIAAIQSVSCLHKFGV